jgi:hypothetical protein
MSRPQKCQHRKQNQVMQSLLQQAIDHRTAAQILCGLQMAAGQVKSGNVL